MFFAFLSRRGRVRLLYPARSELEQAVIDLFELSEETREQVEIVVGVDHSTGLSDAVHGKLWDTDVDSLKTEGGIRKW